MPSNYASISPTSASSMACSASTRTSDRKTVAEGKRVEFRRVLFRSDVLVDVEEGEVQRGCRATPRLFPLPARPRWHVQHLPEHQIGRPSQRESEWSSDVCSSDLMFW